MGLVLLVLVLVLCFGGIGFYPATGPTYGRPAIGVVGIILLVILAWWIFGGHFAGRHW